MSRQKTQSGFSRRAIVKTAVAGAGMAVAGFPAILRAQSDTIRVGHLTPRTGFLGQLGDYGFRASSMAVEEANAAGGVLGRKVELIAEDSVNPGVAVTKAQKLVEQNKVHFILGEISSGSALAIADQAQRYKILYLNTGANSDALRGKNCNRYMFHVEGCNTMYTKTIGQWQVANNKIKGTKYYMLTADYAFGHDLARVSNKFLTENGGTVVQNDLVPTDTPDYSSYILKIRQARPDFVYINLAGSDQTTFLKQYKEYGLPMPVSGGVMDTIPFWGAGIDSISGYWQSLWYHDLNVPATREFARKFSAKHGHPPDNQAWGDYVAIRILLQGVTETKSTDTAKLIEFFEKGAEFDILKGRKGQFRAWDHQLLQEMYVVKVKDKKNSKDKWDIFEVVEAVPKQGQSLELIQPTKGENPCAMPA
jgi:branched-chain amino acid transport system substrate-binding protein